MFEYEYRLSVQCENYKSILGKLIKLYNITKVDNYTVYYFRPHFRFKNNVLEWKETISNLTVYHDGLWFKFTESEEILFENFSKNMHLKFLEIAGQYQNPFTIESRIELKFPGEERLKVYGFEKRNLSGIMFEFELFDKKDKIQDMKSVIIDTKNVLNSFRDIYKFFRHKSPFPYTMRDCTRKSVIPERNIFLLQQQQQQQSNNNKLLVAKKYNGVFGFVYSFRDEIREIWEDNQFRLRRGKSLGNGLVFGAERMSNGTVILLDVYQVRGSTVFTTEDLLLEFLPQMKNINNFNNNNNNNNNNDNKMMMMMMNKKKRKKRNNKIYSRYKVQKYSRNIESFIAKKSSNKNNNNSSNNNRNEKNFDGFIFHDTNTDTIYKLKTKHTIDLVHFNGYFLFPDNTKKKTDYVLKNGVVYECSLEDLKPLKERTDRFVGNTNEQIVKIKQAAATTSTT